MLFTLQFKCGATRPEATLTAFDIAIPERITGQGPALKQQRSPPRNACSLGAVPFVELLYLVRQSETCNTEKVNYFETA